MKTVLELVIAKYQNDPSGQSSDSIQFLSHSYFTLLVCVNETKNTNEIAILRNNFYVNCVTFLEAFLKEVINEEVNWNERGYKELLNQKVTLNDAFEAFKTHDLTREFVISQFASFQSIESIQNVFSKLTGGDFFSEIECAEIFESKSGSKVESTSLIKEFPNWRRDLSGLFEIRHKYVHESKSADLTAKDIEKILGILIFFHQAMLKFLLDR